MRIIRLKILNKKICARIIQKKWRGNIQMYNHFYKY